MSKRKTPEIRFAGFTGEWEKKSLKGIAKRITRKNKKLESTLPLTISAQEGLISQSDFFDKRVASRDVSGYYLIKKGEFAYNKSYSQGYPFGAVKRLDRYNKGVLSTLYILFELENANSNFIVSYYDTNKWHREVSMRAAEGARNHGLLNISVTDFFDTKLKLPPTLPEQTRIGEFFKNLDDTIALHEQELEQLKQTKAGFLQKMFPAEGETTPALRFAGFTGDWEECTFGDFTQLSQGLQIAINKRYLCMGQNRKFYITNEFLNPNNHKEYYIESPPANVIAKKDDILMTRTGNTGKVITNVEGAFHNNFFKISYDKKKNSKLFIYFLLTSFKLQKELLIRAGTSTIPDLNHKDFYKIIIAKPTLEEQTRIGDFFQSLDNLIALKQKELEDMKQTKAGFLQKMFI